MTMEMTKRTDPDRQLRRQLGRQVELGRLVLLVILGITFIDQILLLCGVRYHFFLSCAMPYYLNWLALELDVTAFKAVATVVTLMIYVGLAGCWLLSGRLLEWMLAALVFYSVDTLLLAVFALTLLEKPSACLLEILTHGIGIAALYFSFRALERLTKMPRRRPRSAEPDMVS